MAEADMARQEFLRQTQQLVTMWLVSETVFAEERQEEPRTISSQGRYRLSLPRYLENTLAADGLRIVDESRYQPTDLQGHKKSSRQLPYACIGDFDGNGKQDVALIHESDWGLLIVVVFGRKNNSYEILRVRTLDKVDAKVPIRYALQLHPPAASSLIGKRKR
jgi:hypothetical protein